jgi:probable FeS assembly SUF system protein SufT
LAETIQIQRDCEAIAIPSGRRKVLPGGTVVRVVERREAGLTVSTENHAIYRIEAENAGALGLDVAGAGAEQPKSEGLSEKLVWETLRTVRDPELPVNIVDLGLIYSCRIEPLEQTGNRQGGNRIVVRMTLTAPGCGMSEVLKAEVETKLARLPEVAEARVEVVFDPPWNPSRISEAVRMQLGMEIGGGQGLVQLSRDR